MLQGLADAGENSKLEFSGKLAWKLEINVHNNENYSRVTRKKVDEVGPKFSPIRFQNLFKICNPIFTEQSKES